MKRFRRVRSGATTVETALALPILIVFVFSGIEVARVNMIRNAMQNAAYQGARQGIIPGATTTDCSTAAARMVNVLSLEDTTIAVSPSPIVSSTEEVTVSIDVPITLENSFVLPRLYLGKSLNATVRIPRETRF